MYICLWRESKNRVRAYGKKISWQWEGPLTSVLIVRMLKWWTDFIYLVNVISTNYPEFTKYDTDWHKDKATWKDLQTQLCASTNKDQNCAGCGLLSESLCIWKLDNKKARQSLIFGAGWDCFDGKESWQRDSWPKSASSLIQSSAYKSKAIVFLTYYEKNPFICIEINMLGTVEGKKGRKQPATSIKV